MGVRAIMDSLTEIPYMHTKSVRLWKVKAQDEGTRTICNYMEKAKTLEYLDLMDNQIGPLGIVYLQIYCWLQWYYFDYFPLRL